MSDIQEVKSRLDIVDVVGSYVPSLKKAGRSYKANCPFHQEKTPSFVVTPDLQTFKCFGCGEYGDALSFIQKIERVSFGKALEMAAERVGYELLHNYDPKDSKVKELEERIFQANMLAAKYWNYILLTHNMGKAGRDYAQKRQIDKPQIDKFMLGYAPVGKTNLKQFLLKKGFQAKELADWGLLVERDGTLVDKFVDRLMLPIMTLDGRVVGFSGRKVAPSEYAPKYLNSPETPVYKKGEVLMGMFQAKKAAREKNYLIVEEGNIDLLSSHRVGIENIVAVGGTALTLNQCKLIDRLAGTVYFAFDKDAAGLKALLRGLEIAEKTGLKHKAIDLGDFQDPDEMIKADPELWRAAVDKPLNTIAYLAARLQKDLDLGTADGKSAYMERMVDVLRMVQDEVQVQHYAGELAAMVGLTTVQVTDRLQGRVAAKPVATSHDVAAPNQAGYQPASLHTDKRELYLLALLSALPTLPPINPVVFKDVNCRELYDKIVSSPNREDLSAIADELTDGAREILQEILLFEVDQIESLDKEFESIYYQVYLDFLRGEILQLRTALQRDVENDELVLQLQKLIVELKQTESKSR